MLFHQHYPSIGYDPERLWCGFYFDLNMQIAEFKETEEQAAEPLEVRIKRSDDFYSGIASRFPVEEDFYKDINEDQWFACRRFSSVVDKVYLVVEGARAITTFKDTGLCPSMLLELEHSFISLQLHNAQVANHAIPAWMYGLSALRTIYGAFGIDSGFLPTIHFDQKDFLFEVPFLMQDSTPKSHDRLKSRIDCCISRFPSGSKYSIPDYYHDFKVNGAVAEVVPYQSENASHKFAGRVRYDSGNQVLRNRTASQIFIIAALQASHSYQERDFKEQPVQNSTAQRTI